MLWRINSPASRLFAKLFVQAQIKENTKAPRHWPLWGDPPLTSGFSAQRASNTETVSIWWHHHAAGVFEAWQLVVWMDHLPPVSWAFYQIRKIAGCACAGNAGNVFPRRWFQRKLLVSDHGMHHGTCVTHVPWCMSGSLTCGDGENVPGIPGACAPAILRIWQEAHSHLFDFLSLGLNTNWYVNLVYWRRILYRFCFIYSCFYICNRSFPTISSRIIIDVASTLSKLWAEGNLFGWVFESVNGNWWQTGKHG